MTASSDAVGKIKTAVITGHHPYDVVNLQRLFRGIVEIDAYPQNMEDFVTDTGHGPSGYDVVVFYNYHLPTPGGDEDALSSETRAALDGLAKSGAGILLLHHAILAYPEWQLWSDIAGIPERRAAGSDVQQRVRMGIAVSDHPITAGLEPWEIVDETYDMNDASEGCEVLLTTGHPRSMRTIAWTREHNGARVFCYQSGHDDLAFDNPSFRIVLSRGIQWLAGRI